MKQITNVVALKKQCKAIATGLLLSLTLFSCDKKKEAVEPDNPYILTEKKLVGKWEVNQITHTLYKGRNVEAIWSFIKDFGEVVDGQAVGSGPWIPEQHTTYLVIKNDHTFYHTNIHGNPDGEMLSGVLASEHGNWVWKNDKTIEFTSYSSWDHSLTQIDWHVSSFNFNGLYLNTKGRINMSGDTTNFEYDEVREIVIAPVN